MMIETSLHVSGNCRSYTLSSEKVTMTITVAPSYITVGVDNSSHRAWRGPGKTFHGADAFTRAAASYKSSTCKAMVEFVAQAERKDLPTVDA